MTRPRGDERHARRFREPSPAVRHVRRRRLVACVQEADVASVRGVVDRQDLIARQREDRLHAVRAQRLDEEVRAGHALPAASTPAMAHS